MSDLAKRAIACKGWRWMPRMVDTTGRTFIEYCGEAACLWVCDDGCEWLPVEGRIPDLTDPATLGCFLALVAQAHGVSLDDAQVVRTTGRVWSVWVFRPDGSPWRVATHEPSRDEALVVALEGAP